MSRAEKERHREFVHELSMARVFENTYEYPETGERRWVIRKGLGWPCCVEDGNYMYVVMPDAEVRFPEFPRPKSEMHHPELCHGKGVIGAGTFKVFNGEIICVDNESGHYNPDGFSMYFVLKVFKYWKLPLSEDVKTNLDWEIHGNN